ncbi:MAG TPA: hypothetical protein VKZ98_00830 [Aquaticitalea sp.]|nr:hypothetical protein [Aquaticitalea sp.]
MKQPTILFALFISCMVWSQHREVPVDTTVTTSHNVTINGKAIAYEVTAGTQPVWGKDNEPTATLFYNYYKRIDNINTETRPLLFSFNGGPGSASVWMHIAYTGPKVLKIDDEGYPIQPYGVKDNPHSILDIADIVYIDPVNTGYSRMIEDNEGKLPERKNFFGINADIKYLAEWMTTFVSRNNRWKSPKYIIGESYGGTRVMGLADELQNNQWMYLNGVIMVSPADYQIYGNGNLSSVANIPYYTAAAWYHKQLPSELQSKDLLEILPEVEVFAIDRALPALTKGGFITDAEKQSVAAKIAYYTSLDKQVVLDENLDVPTNLFWKELLRDKNYTIGRLDSRYLGIDRKRSGDNPDYNAELTSWLHSFTPPINDYLKNTLNFKTDAKYQMFGDVHPWDRTRDNTREGLRQAMAQNPFLNVLVQSGYYDGATTYFQAKLTMGLIDPAGRFKDRFTFKGYRSGHMMYLRNEDLKKSNDDLREFFQKTLTQGKPAKYD